MTTYYSKDHEWIKKETDTTFKIGITDYAQSQLGDIVFVDLPKVGQEISAGAVIAVIESVKAASDIYAPLSGTVVSVNEDLNSAPETINSDAENEGWIFVLEVSADKVSDEISKLINLEDYKKIID